MGDITSEKLLALGFQEETFLAEGDTKYFFKENSVTIFGIFQKPSGAWELYTGSKEFSKIVELKVLYYVLIGEKL
jgi:hypothetical protein